MGADVSEGAATAQPIATGDGPGADRTASSGDTPVAATSRVDAPAGDTAADIEATVIDLRSGDPVIRLGSPETVSRARTPYVRFVKPVLDRLLGTVALVLVAPLLVLVALAIRLSMGKGVLFRQSRVGKDGVVFDVIKFRTMGADRRGESTLYVGPERRQNHKSEDDPRHTGFGRFLRKWSLDEFPQFVNVMKGEMSLVGPRPELVTVVERYEPWQHARHQVRPGITGIWQISERNGTPLHEATHLDIEYVETVSLSTDVGIMLRTVPAMLGRRKGT